MDFWLLVDNDGLNVLGYISHHEALMLGASTESGSEETRPVQR